jgi:ribose transport system substrate-binding protein
MQLNTFAAALFAVTALSTSALADQPAWLKGTLKKPVNQISIGLASVGVGLNGYLATFHQTFDKRAAELGVKVVTLDAQVDPARQAQQIPSLVTQKVDVAIVWPVNSTAILPSLKLLKSAGIPVLNVNTQVAPAGQDDIVAFTGPDDYHEAQVAAQLMVDGLGGKGNVVILTGLPGYSVTKYRVDGFMDVIKNHPDIKVLDTQPANWSQEKAQTLMENFITRFGKTIDGVYSSDGGTGSGALAAGTAAVNEGRVDKGHIKYTDCSIFASTYDSIKAGDYYGSVYQSPVEDANLAFETAVKIAEGIEVPKVAHIPAPPVTKENVDQFPRPTF